MKRINIKHFLGPIFILLAICLYCIIYILCNRTYTIKSDELSMDLSNRILKEYPRADKPEIFNSKIIEDNKILLFRFQSINCMYWGYILYKINAPEALVYDRLYINNFKDVIRFRINTDNNSYIILCNINGDIVVGD